MPERNSTSDDLANLAVELNQSVSSFLKTVVPCPERFLGPSAVSLFNNKTSTVARKKGKKRKLKTSITDNYTLPNECLEVTRNLFNHGMC
jgi:hypothetical protein